MSASDIVHALAVGPPAVPVERTRAADGVVLSVPAAHVRRACELLRDEPEGRYDLLLAVVASGGQVRYQLASLAHRRRLRLRAVAEPGAPPVASVAHVWPAANWAEREAQDLLHVRFHAHPDPAPLVRAGEGAAEPPGGEVRLSFAPGTRFPSSVGGLAVDVEAEGDQVVRAVPRLSAAHVGAGARMARWDYRRATHLAARVDAFSAMTADLAYALAIECLLEIAVPQRAQVLRTLYAELQRVSSHLYWLANTLSRFSPSAFAAPAHLLQAREAILDLFAWLGGNAVTPDVIAVGGLRSDAPQGLPAHVRRLADDLERLLSDLDLLLEPRGGVHRRLRGLGVLDRGTAVGLGVTGPPLRACGVPYDVRTAFPYAAYGTLSIEPPVEHAGDAWARLQIRRRELRASLDLLRQCLSALPPGDVRSVHAEDLPDELPAGAAYAGVEGPRGELGVLVASGGADGTCIYVRGPSFTTLSALPYVASGVRVDQFALLVDSLDLSACEAAR